MDRPPVHELSAVNCHSLRFKCRATSGATELTLGPGERRVLRLPILKQPDGQGNLETVVVIWTPGLTKDENGHSRFEVH
jgi:hypothetical protein